LKYIGQTGWTFKINFKEHMRDIENNGLNSRFAQHIFDTTHEYSTMDKTMEILYISKKGWTLDTYERFHIYEVNK
jgi:ferritin-like metal-binding protein YciE